MSGAALAGFVFAAVLLTALWCVLLVLVANRARTVLARAAVRRWLDRVSAAVLIGFGIRVALEGP